jgi:hypothetical protein
VAGKPLQPGAHYKLATKQFLAEGKDGYDCLVVSGAAGCRESALPACWASAGGEWGGRVQRIGLACLLGQC